MINIAKSVAVTGHRIVKRDLDELLLEKTFLSLIENDYDTFLIGMALGFDSICFRKLEEIRRKRRIKIIACIPCLDQAEKFNKEQKEEYERMLLSADEKVVLSDKYTNRCMQKRNVFMVDNSSILISYLREEKSGTGNTVRYAKSKGKKIIAL